MARVAKVRVDGKFRASPGTAEAYVAATILIALGAVVRWGLGFLGTPFLPFTTFYPAVLFATYLGGLRVGIFAAIRLNKCTAVGVRQWCLAKAPVTPVSRRKYCRALDRFTNWASASPISCGESSWREMQPLCRDLSLVRALSRRRRSGKAPGPDAND